MSEVLGHGVVQVDVEDEGLRAGLRRAEAEYQRTMNAIDRMHAEASVGADLTELKRDLKQAEAELKRFDKRRVNKKLTNDERVYAARQVKLLEDQVAEKRKLVYQGQKLLDATKRENAELVITEKRIAAIDKLERAREREYAAAAKRKQALELKNTRELEKQEKLQERISTKAAQDAARAAAARAKEEAAIPKMNRQYAELAQKIERLNRARSKVKRDQSARVVVDLKIEEAVSDMEALKRRLTDLGRRPPVEVVVHPGQDFGLRLRNAITMGRNDGGVHRAAINTGIVLGASIGEGMRRGIRNAPRSLFAGIGGLGSKFRNVMEGLSQMTVRIGPFTATIRQAFTALAVLGPVLLDIVGALGALVGVVGSATLGVGALGAAFLGGAIPAAIGMGFVIKDVAQEFTAAKKATKAYDDAVLKHGAGSKQAAKKMKELKNVMGGVSEATAKQFREGQKLGTTWDKLTKPAHASVWKVIGNSMEAAGKMMPMFAKNTNEAMGAAEKGVSKWMKALSSGEGRRVLNRMMDNFTRSMKPAMSGLGNLAAYFGKVGAEASKYLPGIMRTFDRWASRLNDAATGEGFANKIRRIVQSAKDLGRFLLAGGRLMKAFFGGGVTEGQNFLNVMTQAMNRWTAFLNTTEGRNQLGDFFRESVEGARTLWSVLAPIGGTFITWASMIAPAVRMLLEGVAWVTQLVAGFIKLVGLQGPLSALVTTLGVLWGIGKISAATRAVAGFTKALLGMGAAQKAVAASSATSAAAAAAAGAAAGRATAGARAPVGRPAPAGTALAALGGTLVGAGVAKTAANVGKLAKAGGVATTAMRGLGLATLGIASPIAGAAIVAGGLAFGMYKLATRTRDYEKAQKGAEASTRAYNESSRSMTDVQNALAQEHLNVKNAELGLSGARKEVNRLAREGKTNTDEYRQAQLNLQQAELSLAGAKRQVTAATDLETQTYRRSAREAVNQLKERNRQVQDLGKQGNTKQVFDELNAKAKATGKSLKEMVEASRMPAGEKARVLEYADALGAQERAQARVRRAQELSTLASLNHQRAIRGIGALAQSTAGHFARLAKLSRSVATKVAVKFTDSGDAARVARSASATLRSGIPARIVSKIVMDSKSAEDAVRRLQRARITPKRVEIIENGGKAAVRMVERLSGIKLGPKRQAIVERGGQAAINVLARILGITLPPKRANTSAPGANAAIGQLNTLRSIHLPDKTQNIIINTFRNTINTVTNKVKQALDKRARGQKAGSRPVNALIGEGRDDEWRVNRRTGEVYKTSGPQFVRLDADDAIIPTEPRYRDRGREIFKAIAKDLGMNMFQTGRDARQRRATPRAKPRQQVFGGSFGDDGFQPSVNLPRKQKTFKPSKKKSRGSLKINRGWADYIEGLHTQQSYWEREVSIRESMVKEPSETVIEVGSKDVKDPFTGEVTKVPIYAVNPEIEKTYKPALAHVMEAMRELMRIIVELVRAIPMAVMANKQEQAYREQAKDSLDDKIRKDKNRIKGSKGERREKYERQLSQHEEARDKHVEGIKALKESEKQLKADRVEAGFDQREAQIAYNDIKTEHDTASGDAETARAKEQLQAEPTFTDPNAGGSGGGGSGGGGSGSDTLSYGQQASLADTERANVLREFGSNMASLMTRSGGAMMPGAGPGAANAAMRDPNGGGSASAFGSSRAASAAATPAGGGGGGSGSAAPASGGDKTVVINNTFHTPPPEPHTFVKGMEYESQGAF